MGKRRNIIFLTLCSLLFLFAPNSSCFSELQWPLKEKTYITGSFGEFRKNHIHAGLDISTRGKTGIPVYASETGILYRIKIEYRGFGKAVYVKLSNGTFLVYAHLNKFSPKIEEIAKEEQIKNDSYAIDTHPVKNIPIKKGELIGYSGDTGGVAPHLHFELRDSEERPLNVLKHGLNANIQDKIPPVITSIAICDPLDTHCTKSYLTKNMPKEIALDGERGLAIAVHDTSGKNKLGFYQLELIIDDKLFFLVKMDSFSYDNFYDNFLLCNKGLYVNHNKIYYHLFMAFNNNLPFYPLDSTGILGLSPGRHSVTINAIDNLGNKSTVGFNIIYAPASPKKEQKQENGPWHSQDKLCSVNIDKKDLYYPIKVKIEEIPLKRKYNELMPVSKTYGIKPKEAVFKKMTVSIKQPENTDKVGLYKYEDGKWKFVDEKPIRNFTRFALFRDATPPTVKIISTRPIFRARIEDNGSGLDYKKLSLILDDNKVIAEYSLNKKELFYKTASKRQKITCIAVDKMGNVTKKEIDR